MYDNFDFDPLVTTVHEWAIDESAKLCLTTFAHRFIYFLGMKALLHFKDDMGGEETLEKVY